VLGLLAWRAATILFHIPSDCHSQKYDSAVLHGVIVRTPEPEGIKKEP